MSIITEGGLYIAGVQAMAGFCSTILVKSNRTKSKDGILFDCGVLMQESIHANWVFISHGHVDHVGAAISHARARALTNGPATYYVPEGIEEDLQIAKEAFGRMDGKDIPMDIRVMRPGESALVGSKNQYRVLAFATTHRVQSQGYAIYSTSVEEPSRLMDIYKHLPGPEIGILKKQGVEVSIPAVTKEHLDLVYTGDTTFSGLLLPETRFIFTAEILITECTYLDGPQEKALTHQHIHLQDIAEHVEYFQNRQIVLTHISARHKPCDNILRILRNCSLPAEFKDRVAVTLRAFGMNDDLTQLTRPEGEHIFKRAPYHDSGDGGHTTIKASDKKKKTLGLKKQDGRCAYFFSERGCRFGAACDFKHMM